VWRRDREEEREKVGGGGARNAEKIKTRFKGDGVARERTLSLSFLKIKEKKTARRGFVYFLKLIQCAWVAGLPFRTDGERENRFRC
jgi:hypothetical protein